MKSKFPLPVRARNALKKLGQDLRFARLRRRIPMALMSARASISRTTLTKIEKGDPTVSMESYAAVIFVLGLLPNLERLAEIENDEVGRMLEEEKLPKRIRFPKIA